MKLAEFRVGVGMAKFYLLTQVSKNIGHWIFSRIFKRSFFGQNSLFTQNFLNIYFYTFINYNQSSFKNYKKILPIDHIFIKILVHECDTPKNDPLQNQSFF